jgi:hypothetical protein
MRMRLLPLRMILWGCISSLGLLHAHASGKALIYFQGEAVAKRLAVSARISGTIVTPWRARMGSKKIG